MNEPRDHTTGPLNVAVERMTAAFGSPGKAALRLFLEALPSDAMIAWDGMPQVAAGVVAHRLFEELAKHG